VAEVESREELRLLHQWSKKENDNNGWAKIQLGQRYEYGIGVKQNYSRAKDLYMQATLTPFNNGRAEFHLAQLYRRGDGKDVMSFKDARTWALKSIHSGIIHDKALLKWLEQHERNEMATEDKVQSPSAAAAAAIVGGSSDDGIDTDVDIDGIGDDVHALEFCSSCSRQATDSAPLKE